MVPMGANPMQFLRPTGISIRQKVGTHMDELLAQLTLHDLTGEQRDIAELIGVNNYIQLVKEFGGMSIYILKMENVLRARRNAQIINKFNGSNYRALAVEYGLSEMGIRNIVCEKLVTRPRE